MRAATVTPAPGVLRPAAGTPRALGACRRRRLGAGARGGADGGSSSVEFAILFPIIVVLLFAGPQLAMWWFAREAADAAALAGARAASAQGAPAGAGRAAAETYLAEVATGTITGHTIEETNSATTVTIHIHATVPNVIPLPGFSPALDVTVVRGRERFTTPDSP